MHALQDAADRFHAKLSQAEQAKRDSQAAGRSRVKREKEEHAARGPVPQPCRDFRLPQAQVPALLMVWELTQVSLKLHCRLRLIFLIMLAFGVLELQQHKWHRMDEKFSHLSMHARS